MIRIVRAGPTEVRADALMRSVGADLEACSGVGKAIGAAAGAEVLNRLRAFGDLPVGGAVVTPAGNLPVSLLIHVVIRSAEEPVSPDRVARAFRNGLRQAAEWAVETLAVPPLGMGAGNLDAETSSRVMCAVLNEHRHEAAHPSEVVIVAPSAYEEEVFAREGARVFDTVPDELPVIDGGT